MQKSRDYQERGPKGPKDGTKKWWRVKRLVEIVVGLDWIRQGMNFRRTPENDESPIPGLEVWGNGRILRGTPQREGAETKTEGVHRCRCDQTTECGDEEGPTTLRTDLTGGGTDWRIRWVVSHTEFIVEEVLLNLNRSDPISSREKTQGSCENTCKTDRLDTWTIMGED